jgi:hypothetical protein
MEKKVEKVYGKHTGNSWDAGEQGVGLLSNAKDVLHELGNRVPCGYLAGLRKVWETVKSAK